MNLNRLHSFLYTSIRRFSRRDNFRYNGKMEHTNKQFIPRQKTLNPGVQRKLDLMTEDDKTSLDDVGNLEDFADSEDPAELQPDLMKIGALHDVYEKEVVQMKKTLANRITRTKMVKEVNPSFLTFAEKIEIQSLHRQDPVRWSSERLSESFPALEDDIKKIIKSKWIPRSVKEVQSYDQKVIDNWEKYQARQIAITPEFEQHLEKFNNRTVIAASEEYIKENIIMAPIEFPPPKSTTFSRIITKHQKAADIPESKVKSIDKPQSDTMEVMEYLNVPVVEQSLQVVQKDTEKRPNFGVQTFSEFLENSVSTLEDSTTPLGIAVKHVYNVEKEKEVQNKMDKRKMEEMMEMEKEESNLEVYEEPAASQSFGEGDLATYVKNWVKKEEAEYDFPALIKIPRNKYIKGMTYRVKDCYYDDDGAFLYRVPGVRT